MVGMENRLFAVHDHSGEGVRIEETPDSLSRSEILMGSGWTSLLKEDWTLRTPEVSLAWADATGQIHLIPPSVRSPAEAISQDLESISEVVVQPTSVSQKPAGRHLNWFLNHRINAVLLRIRGRLLDVGCGVNELVKRYGNGLGVERGTDIPNTEKFDTVTLVAVLNYISEEERGEVLKQCHERMNKFGRLILTCRLPNGLKPRYIISLVEENGFRLVYSRPFMLWLNRVYVFGKEESKGLPVAKEGCHEEKH